MLALATVPLSLGGPARGRAWPVVALLALMAWLALPPGLLLRRSFPILAQPEVKALALDEGTNESILVAEAPAGRALYTNGHSMSGTVWGSQRYMRAMAHVPLLLTERPRRALVICFGVGNTAHAASLHPLESLEVVDLSRHVLEHAGHFSATNGNVLADSRVRVAINDGRQHLRMLPEGSLDLVTLEPPPIDFAGVAGLYSREFYALAASRLRPGGFITQWLPLYQVPPVVAVSLARAFVEVFPGATVLSGHGAELVLLGRKGEAVSGEFGAVARRMAERPTVLEDMERMQLSSPEAWAGLPVLSPASLAALTADAVPLTDDWPISEYASAHRADLHRLDPAWFQPAPAAWCGPCAEAPGISRWVQSLAERYREAPFLEGAAFTLPAPLQPVR
jgi:spermidine synthase